MILSRIIKYNIMVYIIFNKVLLVAAVTWYQTRTVVKHVHNNIL